MYHRTEDTLPEDLINTPQNTSKLVSYFRLNADPNEELARKLYYYEIPEYYRFEKDKWIRLAKMKGINEPIVNHHPDRIGRMYFVDPSQKPLFHLRYYKKA